MLRYFAAVALFAVLLIWSPTETNAQRQMGRTDVGLQYAGLVGMYRADSGGIANIYRSGRGYLFVDEAGDRAWFEPTSATRLEMVGGNWAPMVVTVGQHYSGRVMLRFDSQVATGYWVKIS